MQEFYFAHETIEVPVQLTGDTAVAHLHAAAAGEAGPSLLDIGLDPEGETFTYEMADFLTLSPDKTPLRVTFEGALPEQPDTSVLDKVLDKYEGQAEFSLDFGHDKLTVTFSTEGGGGAGEGAEGGTGESATVTGNVKFFWAAPLFPMSMFYKAKGDASTSGETNFEDDGPEQQQGPGPGERLKTELKTLVQDPESIGMFLRFILRFLYHSTDAVRLAVQFVKDYEKEEAAAQDTTSTTSTTSSSGTQEEEREKADWTTKWFGFTYWLNVFLLFAMKDALVDLTKAHPQWIANLLQKLEFQFEFNALASLSGTAYVSLDVNETVSGKVKIPLATLLVPVIDALCAGVNTTTSGGSGNTTPGQGGAPQAQQGSYGANKPDLIDLISPYIKGVVEDRTCIKLGGFPAAFEVESRGTIASGTFGFPPDSRLRKKMRDLGKDMADAAIEYKAKKTSTLPREEKWLVLVKAVLDQLDQQVDALVINRNFSKSWETGMPFAEMIMGKVMEEVHADGAVGETGLPVTLSRKAQWVLAYLSTKMKVGTAELPVQAVPHGSNGRYLGIVEATDQRPRTLWILVHADARAHVDALFPLGGPSPDGPPDAGEEEEERTWLVFPSDEPTAETVTFTIPLPARPARVGWHVLTSEDGQATRGIIAGFDTEAEANGFTLEAGVPNVTWDPPDGRFYRWVTTALPGQLLQNQLPLPHLVHEGSTLRLSFWRVPVDKLTPTSVPFLALATPSATIRRPMWRLDLMTDPTPGEEARIRQQLAVNQVSGPRTEAVPSWNDPSWGAVPDRAAEQGPETMYRPWKEEGYVSPLARKASPAWKRPPRLAPVGARDVEDALDERTQLDPGGAVMERLGGLVDGLGRLGGREGPLGNAPGGPGTGGKPGTGGTSPGSPSGQPPTGGEGEGGEGDPRLPRP